MVPHVVCIRVIVKPDIVYRFINSCDICPSWSVTVAWLLLQIGLGLWSWPELITVVL